MSKCFMSVGTCSSPLVTVMAYSLNPLPPKDLSMSTPTKSPSSLVSISSSVTGLSTGAIIAISFGVIAFIVSVIAFKTYYLSMIAAHNEVSDKNVTPSSIMKEVGDFDRLTDFDNANPLCTSDGENANSILDEL